MCLFIDRNWDEAGEGHGGGFQPRSADTATVEVLTEFATMHAPTYRPLARTCRLSESGGQLSGAIVSSATSVVLCKCGASPSRLHQHQVPAPPDVGPADRHARGGAVRRADNRDLRRAASRALCRR